MNVRILYRFLGRPARRRRTKDRKNSPPPPTTSSIQLSEGDDHKGWTLEQIELDAALFVRGEEEAWLEFSFDVAAPVQPRRPSRNDDEDHEDDRPVTIEERQWIMGVLLTGT